MKCVIGIISSLLTLAACAIVDPQFEYRGRIPGSTLDVKNAESFTIDLTNRLARLEHNDPGAISGIVKRVNGQLPDNAGAVSVNVGVLTINGLAPDTNGNIVVDTSSSSSYTNAMFAMCSNPTITAPQNIYSVDVGDAGIYVITAPARGIPGISSVFSYIISATSSTMIRLSNFDTEWLLVPNGWTGVIPSGVTELTFIEYATGKYMIQSNTLMQYTDSPDQTPLCFIADSSSIDVSMTVGGDVPSLEYSLDNRVSWTPFVAGVTTVSVQANKTMYLRAPSSGNATMDGAQFQLSGRARCTGNIMSLLDGSTASRTISATGAFADLFSACGTNLLSCPELPATTLSAGCYSNMFANCTSIVSAPNLPAALVPENGYRRMFYGCTGLIRGSDMYATTLGAGSCVQMFMFCENLSFLRVKFTTWKDEAMMGWVRGVSTLTTSVFRCPESLPHDDSMRSNNGIPQMWSVITE